MQHACFSFSEKPPLEATAFRTPGYPLFLALIMRCGGSFSAAAAAICAVRRDIVAALSRGFAFRQARRGGHRRAAVRRLLADGFSAALSPHRNHFHLFDGALRFSADRVFASHAVPTKRGGHEANGCEANRAIAALPAGFRHGAYAWHGGADSPIAGDSPYDGAAGVVGVAAKLGTRAGITRHAASLWFAPVSRCVSGRGWHNILVARKPIPFAISSGISLFVSAQQYSNHMSYAMTMNEDWIPLIALKMSGARSTTPATAKRRAARNAARNLAGHPAEIVVDKSFMQDAARIMSRLTPVQIIACSAERAPLTSGVGAATTMRRGRGQPGAARAGRRAAAIRLLDVATLVAKPLAAGSCRFTSRWCISSFTSKAAIRIRRGLF